VLHVQEEVCERDHFHVNKEMFHYNSEVLQLFVVIIAGSCIVLPVRIIWKLNSVSNDVNEIKRITEANEDEPSSDEEITSGWHGNSGRTVGKNSTSQTNEMDFQLLASEDRINELRKELKALHERINEDTKDQNEINQIVRKKLVSNSEALSRFGDKFEKEYSDVRLKLNFQDLLNLTLEYETRKLRESLDCFLSKQEKENRELTKQIDNIHSAIKSQLDT